MLRGKLGKKAMAICLAASSVLLIACGGSTAQESGTPDSSAKGTEVASEEAGTNFEGKTIEIATYLSGDTLSAYKQVIADFESETGVKVTLDEYGDDYESTMKTRMASNDLPDIFETRGAIGPKTMMLKSAKSFFCRSLSIFKNTFDADFVSISSLPVNDTTHKLQYGG